MLEPGVHQTAVVLRGCRARPSRRLVGGTSRPSRNLRDGRSEGVLWVEDKVGKGKRSLTSRRRWWGRFGNIDSEALKMK